MPYLIDGHNLIAQLPDISLDDPDDEAKLVTKLRGFIARTRTRCVVVFDHGLPGGESRMSSHSLKVIFAATHHSTADRIIAKRIRNNRQANKWTVVSLDREVLQQARFYGAKTVRADVFAQMLNRPKPKQGTKPEQGEPTLSEQEIDEWLQLFGSDDE